MAFLRSTFYIRNENCYATQWLTARSVQRSVRHSPVNVTLPPSFGNEPGVVEAHTLFIGLIVRHGFLQSVLPDDRSRFRN